MLDNDSKMLVCMDSATLQTARDRLARCYRRGTSFLCRMLLDCHALTVPIQVQFHLVTGDGAPHLQNESNIAACIYPILYIKPTYIFNSYLYN